MDKNRPPESPELVAVDMQFHYFVSHGIPVPPGTPASPRPDRPPYILRTDARPEEEGKQNDAPEEQ
jgi:hypothetical protein